MPLEIVKPAQRVKDTVLEQCLPSHVGSLIQALYNLIFHIPAAVIWSHMCVLIYIDRFRTRVCAHTQHESNFSKPGIYPLQAIDYAPTWFCDITYFRFQSIIRSLYYQWSSKGEFNGEFKGAMRCL